MYFADCYRNVEVEAHQVAKRGISSASNSARICLMYHYCDCDAPVIVEVLQSKKGIWLPTSVKSSVLHKTERDSACTSIRFGIMSLASLMMNVARQTYLK